MGYLKFYGFLRSQKWLEGSYPPFPMPFSPNAFDLIFGISMFVKIVQRSNNYAYGIDNPPPRPWCNRIPQLNCNFAIASLSLKVLYC